jgi:hypothetical protein
VFSLYFPGIIAFNRLKTGMHAMLKAACCGKVPSATFLLLFSMITIAFSITTDSGSEKQNKGISVSVGKKSPRVQDILGPNLDAAVDSKVELISAPNFSNKNSAEMRLYIVWTSSDADAEEEQTEEAIQEAAASQGVIRINEVIYPCHIHMRESRLMFVGNLETFFQFFAIVLDCFPLVVLSSSGFQYSSVSSSSTVSAGFILGETRVCVWMQTID